MSDVDVHLNIAMTPRVFGGALFFLLLGALPRELASEAVTLNSYYPAPSGIYTQMISTDNTFLARDGGFVQVGSPSLVSGVGSIQAPSNTTGINSTKLVVYGGNVGFGVANPLATVHVEDTRPVPGPVAVAVNGQIVTGTTADPVPGNNYKGMVYLNASQTQYVGTNGGTMITMSNGGAALNVDNNGNVGICTTSNIVNCTPVGLALAPNAPLDVAGAILVRNVDFSFPLP